MKQMRWIKQPCSTYREPVVLALDDATEVLMRRAREYAGDTGTQGFVPAAIIPGLMRAWTPARGRKAAKALVDAQVWEPRPGGWFIAGWDTEQADLDALENRRRSERERQADHRKRGRLKITAPVVPDVVVALRDALDGKGISPAWSSLTQEEVDEVAGLVGVHGVDRLVACTTGVWQPGNPARSVRAFLPAWRDLRAPRPRVTRRPWCGGCVEETRMTDDDRPARCPVCG